MSTDYLWPHLRDLPYFRALLRAVEARLMEGLDLPRPVLDIGSGDGHFSSVAFPQGLEVGVDPDLAITREAQRRGIYRLLLVADGARLPLASRSFASAVSNSVLEHVAALPQVLAEIARVLKPGAPFVFTVPNPGYRDMLSVPTLLRRLGLARLGGAYQEWFMGMSRTVNLMDEAQWAGLLQETGFELVRSQRYFSPAALHVLEWGHYFGAPCLLPRRLLGRWIVAPYRWNLWLTERWLRRYYLEPPDERGTYTFFLARRRAAGAA